MRTENQVCTLEQAKRLKKLGIINETPSYEYVARVEIGLYMAPSQPVMDGKYSWVIRQENIPPALQQEIDDDNLEDAGEAYSAFTVAELGVMLPSEVYTRYTGTKPYKNAPWEWVDEKKLSSGIFDTEAQARSTLLIYLLETNQLTAAECNERLREA